jgi:hypothetical protein
MWMELVAEMVEGIVWFNFLSGDGTGERVDDQFEIGDQGIDGLW